MTRGRGVKSENQRQPPRRFRQSSVRCRAPEPFGCTAAQLPGQIFTLGAVHGTLERALERGGGLGLAPEFREQLAARGVIRSVVLELLLTLERVEPGESG